MTKERFVWKPVIIGLLILLALGAVGYGLYYQFIIYPYAKGKYIEDFIWKIDQSALDVCYITSEELLGTDDPVMSIPDDGTVYGYKLAGEDYFAFDGNVPVSLGNAGNGWSDIDIYWAVQFTESSEYEDTFDIKSWTAIRPLKPEELRDYTNAERKEMIHNTNDSIRRYDNMIATCTFPYTLPQPSLSEQMEADPIGTFCSYDFSAAGTDEYITVHEVPGLGDVCLPHTVKLEDEQREELRELLRSFEWTAAERCYGFEEGERTGILYWLQNRVVQLILYPSGRALLMWFSYHVDSEFKADDGSGSMSLDFPPELYDRISDIIGKRADE